MQVGEAISIKFSRFKKKYTYDCGKYGFILEKVGGGICFYATDAAFDDIFCVVPLGFEKDFKDVNYYIYSVDEHRMFFRVRRAVLLIDFAHHWVSTNVENFKVFGSPEWGTDCLVSWKDSFTRLYNNAENKRNGKPLVDYSEAEETEE